MYEIYAKLRDEQNLTDYRIAKDLGISRTTFVSWRDGVYTPKQDKLQKIADYFGVSIEYLTTGQEKASPYDKFAVLLTGIMKDYELLEVLKIYSKLPPEKKKHIVEVFRLLCSE